MGGDHGLSVVIPACVAAMNQYANLKLILVGDSQEIKKHLSQSPLAHHNQYEIVHASEVVGMDELPSQALRSKKDSSMRVAVNLVKSGEAHACVSAGNTGALMAIARFVLKTIPGIDRPAIIAKLPNPSAYTRVIDLGANLDSCAEHLFQFAVMGAAFIQALDQKTNPKIGLLNIGVEEIKGNDQIKRTAHMLSSCQQLNYVGYVEGHQFYTGDVDLVVCDGFVGNVALKASEGLAKFILNTLRESFSRNWISKMSAFLARPAMKYLKTKIDPTYYNGACLLGLNGVVIKSHGSAKEKAYQNAIVEAMLQVKYNVIGLVKDQITEFVNQGLIL